MLISRGTEGDAIWLKSLADSFVIWLQFLTDRLESYKPQQRISSVIQILPPSAPCKTLCKESPSTNFLLIEKNSGFYAQTPSTVFSLILTAKHVQDTAYQRGVAGSFPVASQT